MLLRLPAAFTGVFSLLFSVAVASTQECLVKPGDTVAFLGDSITEGGAGHPAGYVRRVEAGLQANDIKINVVPAGISGHKSNQMLERLERDVLSKKPTWMTLSCGVNDVWHGANGVPLDAYKQNITEIVDKAQAAGIKVMLLTSTVIGEDLENDNNKKINEYNAFLRSLATQKKCLFADLNADMQEILKTKKTSDLRLTSDGVHMNPLGDRVMALGVLKAFGLNADQLKTANTHWLNEPNTCQVNAGLPLSLRDYETLRNLAETQGISFQDLLQQATTKALQKLLESAH